MGLNLQQPTWASPRYTGVTDTLYVPLKRTSRAEAYLRNGQVDKATEDINALRERAECAKLFTEGEVDVTQSSMRGRANCPTKNNDGRRCCA